MLERLNRLVKTCKSTEPDSPDDNWLFTPHVIDAHQIYYKVNHYYDSLSVEEKVEIMKQANAIWKIRRKIWNGEFDFDWQHQLESTIEELLRKGHKINAIKTYRDQMSTISDSSPTLKDCKHWVDEFETGLIASGRLIK
jgi:uncharacterized coiled-coil DUF342 family protein